MIDTIVNYYCYCQQLLLLILLHCCYYISKMCLHSHFVGDQHILDTISISRCDFSQRIFKSTGSFYYGDIPMIPPMIWNRYFYIYLRVKSRKHSPKKRVNWQLRCLTVAGIACVGVGQWKVHHRLAALPAAFENRNSLAKFFAKTWHIELFQNDLKINLHLANTENICIFVAYGCYMNFYDWTLVLNLDGE